MNEELTEFLRRNRACADGLWRLENHGAETLEQAWEKAAPADLVWAVTRPGVMSAEQRRQFLVFVLGSIEGKLTDARSKNILEKLRTKSPITEADAAAAWAVARASSAADAAWAASRAADAAWAAARAAYAEAYAEAYAARAAYTEAYAAAADAEAYAAAYASRAAYAEAYAEARAADAEADAEAYAAAADAYAWEQQAQWIRDNFALSDLHIN